MTDPLTTPETGTGSVTHLIQVQYDPSTLTLAVSRPNVSINPGDTVVWNFLGIPEGWTPWIEFRRAGNDLFVGPLEALIQAAGGIWGVCRASGWTGTDLIQFEYRATMQRGFASGWDTEGSIAWSAPARLGVLPSPTGTVRVFEVAPLATGLSPTQPPTQPQGGQNPKAPDLRISAALDVQPLGLPLEPGDVVEWQFTLPDSMNIDEWRPRIKFHRYEGTGTVPNQQLGPFVSLSVMPGKIRGTGNNNVNGVYFFEVALISVATGEIGWLSSGDPVVDNRGGVGNPDSG